MSSFLQFLTDKFETRMSPPKEGRGEAAVAPLMWEPANKFNSPNVDDAITNPHVRTGFLRREQALFYVASSAPANSAERAAAAEAYWKFRTLRHVPAEENLVPSDSAARSGLYVYFARIRNMLVSANTNVDKVVLTEPTKF